MAETLVAILLVTSSANGSSLVYRWPPKLSPSPRLSRALPDEDFSPSHLDNPWRASHFTDIIHPSEYQRSYVSYEWSKPEHPVATDTPPSSEPPDSPSHTAPDEYDQVLGYSSEFLAGILCPHRAMSHQKFELVVDDLAFLGHPVCAEADNLWQFRMDKPKPNTRGRESRNRQTSQTHTDNGLNGSPSPARRRDESTQKSAWLHSFHFVMVLDLPDPSSSASGNIAKYFDVLYDKIAFPVTAVLFQEQVVANFVEAECDTLGSLKDSCISKGQPYDMYSSQALQISSIAAAMKSLYHAIKSSDMAYISIHSIPLELQLPPHLDLLLHSEDEVGADLDSFIDPHELEEQGHSDDVFGWAWGPEFGFGWKLPSLAPWKSLLLLDADGFDPYMNLRGPHISSEDRTTVEGLIRFLETASVTVSLADMSTLLDWDLDAQVFPAVRWLVLHRRAKVVDMVHPGLKTIFTLAPKIDAKLVDLSAEFQSQFEDAEVELPSLPSLLATISTSSSKHGDNHFFASVVQRKELIPLYQDVVLWMLKRDLLVTLHLRIRVVATTELKTRVRIARESRAAGREGGWIESETGRKRRRRGGGVWLSLSPKSARRYSRRSDSVGSKLSELNLDEDDDDDELDESEDDEDDDEDDDDEEEEELDDTGGESGRDEQEDDLLPSIIQDPSRATALQRRWLAAMSEGKERHIARRFQQINQFFDGKKTDDEILYRADISRRQLREVLHHYDEYIQTFLHAG